MGVEAAGGNDRTLKKRRERSTLEKKSTLRTRSVSGFVLLFLLLLTLFEGQASAAKTKELLAIAGKVDPEKVRQLIQDGADVNAKDKDGATPLMLAAKINFNPEVLMALIEAGADLNAKNKDGWTSLMVAAQYNPHPKALTALLEAGADAKAKDSKGKTALDYAKDNEKLKDTGALRLLEEKSGQR